MAGPPLPRDYYYAEVAVPTGAVNQQVDLSALLAVGQNPRWQRQARYLTVATTVDLTMRINSTTANVITVDTTDGFQVPVAAMEIVKLFFSHTGASSASGAAAVTVFAT